MNIHDQVSDMVRRSGMTREQAYAELARRASSRRAKYGSTPTERPDQRRDFKAVEQPLMPPARPRQYKDDTFDDDPS